jgi:uncharacterized protein YbjT (DUF2867 family)
MRSRVLVTAAAGNVGREVTRERRTEADRLDASP